MEKFKIFSLIGYFVINTIFVGPILYAVNRNRIKHKQGMVWAFIAYAVFMFFCWPFVMFSSIGKEAIKKLKNDRKK